MFLFLPHFQSANAAHLHQCGSTGDNETAFSMVLITIISKVQKIISNGIVVCTILRRSIMLESEIKTSQERSEKINAGVFASLHRMIKNELREEFKSVLADHVKAEETTNEGTSTMLSEGG